MANGAKEVSNNGQRSDAGTTKGRCGRDIAVQDLRKLSSYTLNPLSQHGRKVRV